MLNESWNALIERAAVNKLHGDEIGAFVLADFMDGYDVRMVQGGYRAGLPQEWLRAFVVWHLRRSKEFDRDGAVELRVARPVATPMRPSPNSF